MITQLKTIFFLKSHTPAPVVTAQESERELAQVLKTEEPEVVKAEVAEISSISEPDESLSSEPETTESPRPTLSPIPSPDPTPTLLPTPVPTPTPDVWSPSDMEPWFSQYAGQYGVDKNILERLANCESHFNPNAVSGNYVGMFQFSASTWSNYRAEMGFDPNPDLRTNAEESIRTAAYAVLHKGVNPWPRCLN